MTRSSIRSVCIYCGSSPGRDPAFVESAAELGRCLARADVALVYGGGDWGLMGAAARACLEAGGTVTGVIPEFLLQREQAAGANGLDGATMIVVPDMHTRKQTMFEKADAFVALPGGIGTLEELVEVLTWAQLSRHTKPIGLLNINEFWSPLLTLVEHMTDQGFLHNPELTGLRIATRADDVLSSLGG